VQRRTIARTMDAPSTAERRRLVPRIATPEYLAVLAGTLVVVAAGAYRLGAPSLWMDEGSSYVLATVRFAEFWDLIARNEASGTPYYLLLRPWAWVSTDEWFLRVPAPMLLFMVLNPRAARSTGSGRWTCGR
jgi:hypothetical protein